jgi:putative sterol carrier protein
MANKEEIKKTLEIISKKFDDPRLQPRFENFTKTMQFTFPDISTSFLIEVTNGNVKNLTENQIDSPDIHVTIESDILIDIINKKTNPMKAYTTGKLKAKGKLTDLLKLQKLL